MKSFIAFSNLPMLLAQAGGIEGSIDKFLILLGKIMLLPAIAMVIYAGVEAHQGRTREAVFALIGAFIFASAVPIARALFGLV